VTGAAGGVGTVSIALLHKLGFTVVASTGRPEEEEFLRHLGASSIIDRKEFNVPVKPLAKARWAGCIDSVGSVTLANILSQMKDEGVVAACGLAQGMDLPSSVAPFILRGVRLIGINSVTTPMVRRQLAWNRIARDLDRSLLASLTTHVRLDDVPRIAADIVQGKVRGRVVVDVA
jgi:acrylyl-CoA reductase (NADPH)